MTFGLPSSGNLPVGVRRKALPTGYSRKQVRLMDRDGLQNLGGEPTVLGNTAADLSDEHLVALAADEACGLLVAVRHWRRCGQEVAHEQSQGLGRHKLIPGQSCQCLVDLVCRLLLE